MAYLALAKNHVAASPAKPARTFRRMSRDDMIQAVKLFAVVGSAKDGRWIYEPGWSDERVRDSIRADLAVRTITLMRQKHIGKTAEEIKRSRRGKAAPAESLAQVAAALAKAEKTITELLERVENLENVILHGVASDAA